MGQHCLTVVSQYSGPLTVQYSSNIVVIVHQIQTQVCSGSGLFIYTLFIVLINPCQINECIILKI